MAKSNAKKKAPEGNETYDVVEMGGNIGPLKEVIAQAYTQVTQLKKERSEINAEIKAVMEKLEANGVTKAAARAAFAYRDADPEWREGYDQAYEIAREALGMPVGAKQGDFFEEEKVNGDENE